MRQAYEPLLVRHQVDVVLSGHVHAYERTKPVVNYQVGVESRFSEGPDQQALQQLVHVMQVDAVQVDDCRVPEASWSGEGAVSQRLHKLSAPAQRACMHASARPHHIVSRACRAMTVAPCT
jgi:hypothetical protein